MAILLLNCLIDWFSGLNRFIVYGKISLFGKRFPCGSLTDIKKFWILNRLKETEKTANKILLLYLIKYLKQALQSGTPNDGFFLNALKTLFRVSRELLDL